MLSLKCVFRRVSSVSSLGSVEPAGELKTFTEFRSVLCNILVSLANSLKIQSM